jgi:hypothetical protein
VSVLYCFFNSLSSFPFTSFCLQIGDLYARNKQYETSNNYYSLALNESLEAYSQRKEEMEKKTRLEIEEDEVENQSEETGRAQSILTRILNKKKNSHSSSKSTRFQDTQSLLLLKQLELSIGSLYKSLAMNNHRMIGDALRSAPPLLLNDNDHNSSSTTALAALQEKHQLSFDQIQEAMKFGVYDQETRVFLSSYPVLCERLFMKENPTEVEKISALKDNNNDDDEQAAEHQEDDDEHQNHPSQSPHYQLGSLKYSSRTRWLIKTLSLPTVKIQESFHTFRREQEKLDAMESEVEDSNHESESADGHHRSGSFGFYQPPDPVEESLSFASNYRQRRSDFTEEHDQRELELENEADDYEEHQGIEEEVERGEQ